MRILFIDQNFDASNIGGAFKSNYAIINEIIKNTNFKISVLATKTYQKVGERFSSKQIRPVLRFPSKKLNRLLKYLKINKYFSFFPIIREIDKFKPNIIIVQRDLAISAIIAAFLKKIPIIHIIRDAMEFCPKDIDTRGFINCTSPLSKEECWECINEWRTLRILLDDKPKGSNTTFKSSLYTTYYKIQYYFTKLHAYLIKFAWINIVASPSMKSLIKKRAKNARVIVRKITPIETFKMEISGKSLEKQVFDRIENSNKNILFVIPRNEGGSKGYPFVKKMLNSFPNDYLLIVVGTILEELKTYQNIINLDKVPTETLYYLYQKGNLTIVPSIYTEAFGRVVLESLINGTPVIVSPQTSANYLFRDKKYVKILPLKIPFWLEEIKNFIDNQINIPEEDIEQIKNNFSPEECANELLKVINKIHFNNIS
ncbi:MAG: glycosyltransferase [Promethearchaeota archaeon]|nr:MAG: glycosyltransferase [Candidatus Lokiarchaeota archaeon]